MLADEYPVRVDVYVMMRNEKMLLPYFLRHYEQFARKIFVWDDHSTDGTTEMLKEHPKVHLLDVDFTGVDDEYSRLHFFPLYKEYSRRQGVHWVMAVDSDEFIYHRNLKWLLWRFRRSYDLITPIGYTMYAEHEPTTDGQIYDEFKLGFRDRLMSKPIIHKPSIDIIYKRGRHYIDTALRSDGSPIRKRWKTGIHLLHYRYFGVDYYIERLKYNMDRHEVGCREYKEVDPKFARKRIWEYRENRPFRMPDGTQGLPRKWFAENKDKIREVVD